MKRTTQQGFTLIELIMVIVILGILAAVALPKFSNMQADARAATLNGALGAINSAIAIVHAKALVSNVTNGNVSMESGNVAVVNGYPAATALGIGAAVQLTGDLTWTTAGTVVGFTPAVTAPANCQITYTASAAVGTPSTAAIDASNCN